MEDAQHNVISETYAKKSDTYDKTEVDVKLANMVSKDDVVPVGDGTETIATIGGKDIKVPAVPVSSVNDKTGAVKLGAQDVGALPLSGGTLTGDLVIGDKERPASRKLTVGADGGANGIQLTGGNVSSGSSMTIGGSSGPGGALVVEDGGSGNASIKKGGKEVATEDQLNAKADLVDGKVPANQLPAVDQSMISDAAGNVIRADGSAVVKGRSSWTCNGIVLMKQEGKDSWRNVEKHWSLTYLEKYSRWMLIAEGGAASTTAPADVTSLSFVINGVTYDATIGREDSVVMAGDVAPKGNGTEVIATIGGKDIKAPTSPVSSVNGKTGEVKLGAQDVGALPLSGGTLTGDLVIGDKERPASRKLTVGADGGANGIQLTGGNVSSGSSMTIGGSSGPGGALVVEDGGSGNASIKKGGKEVATEDQLTPISAQSAYPMSTVVDGALKDRTVNHATAGGTFTFPARTGTNARDFVLVIDALETAPTVTFPGSFTYVSEQDAADIWTAEAGKVNAWYFSEVTDGVFMVCHKAMSVVAQ